MAFNIAERRVRGCYLNFLSKGHMFEKYDARLRNWPLIEDQLDMMYWDQVNGTTVWKDTITKIKEEFPLT